jgi:hypothetical protein
MPPATLSSHSPTQLSLLLAAIVCFSISSPRFKTSSTKTLSLYPDALIFTFIKAPNTADRAQRAATPASVTEFGFPCSTIAFISVKLSKTVCITLNGNLNSIRVASCIALSRAAFSHHCLWQAKCFHYFIKGGGIQINQSQQFIFIILPLLGPVAKLFPTAVPTFFMDDRLATMVANDAPKAPM